MGGQQPRPGLAGLVAALLFCGAIQASSSAVGCGDWIRESWGVEDGLPVQDVSAVLQGPDGYIWIASFDGLVRFDGVRFTVFDAGNTPQLPSSRITLPHETPDGTCMRVRRHTPATGRRSAPDPTGPPGS